MPIMLKGNFFKRHLGMKVSFFFFSNSNSIVPLTSLTHRHTYKQTHTHTHTHTQTDRQTETYTQTHTGYNHIAWIALIDSAIAASATHSQFPHYMRWERERERESNSCCHKQLILLLFVLNPFLIRLLAVIDDEICSHLCPSLLLNQLEGESRRE